MRYVQLLVSRLVRTRACLLPRPVLPARHLWPARALHDFGDPDKFGDLKQPVEKAREPTAGDSAEPESAAALRSGRERGELGGYGGHGGDGQSRGQAAVGGRDGQRDWRRVTERDALTAAETTRASTGRTDQLAVSEHLPADGGHPAAPKNHHWSEPCDERRSTPSFRDRPEAAPAAEPASDATRATSPVTSLVTPPVTSPVASGEVSAAGVVDWELEPDDPEDEAADRLRQLVSQIPQLGISCHAYGRKFHRMVKHGKLREALELFQNQMLLVDKVQPDSYCYNVLISGCGQTGLTKTAFKLYRDMRRRRLKVNHATYTSLLNACANGPSPADSLRRLQQLTNAMAERGYMMNAINYQALVKAYGRCGELQRAFETADELLQLGYPLTAELASFLLQACVSDTDQGFRHALLVWHKLRSKQVEPSIYLYNLMLRAALDCGAGDTAIFEQAMQLIVSAPPPGGAAIAPSAAARSVPAGRQTADSASSFAESMDSRDLSRTDSFQFTAASHWESTASSDSPAVTGLDSLAAGQGTGAAVTRVTDSLQRAGALQTAGAADLPDLLCRRPHRGGLLKLNHLDTAPARLAVLGGWTGLLQTMAADGVQPDVKTFSLLLKTMPNQQAEEESLLRTMDALEVKPDVGFFNQLMKKRASYRNSVGAKAAFSQLEERRLQPDVASFGCLAMAVRDMEDMTQFMDRLKAAEVRPNVEVLTTLLNSAVRAADVPRALAVMEAFVAHQVRPDRRTLLRLEELRLRLQTLLVDRERGRPVPPAAQRASFPDWVRKFRLRYAGWLAQTEAETEQHPHRQYRVRPLTEIAVTAGEEARAEAGAGAGAWAEAGKQLTAGQS